MDIAFTLSYLSSQLSMTVLLVILGLSNHSNLAVDVGIVQAAAAAVFLSFSANARNLIIVSRDKAIIKTIVISRLMLALPLGVCVYFLSFLAGGANQTVAAVLVLRKLVEWIIEVYLSESERSADRLSAYKHLFIESFLLMMVIIGIVFDSQNLFLLLCIWAGFPILLSIKVLVRILKDPSKEISLSTLIPHFGSSAVVGLSVYVFRISILLLAGITIASDMYTAFAIGGLFTSLFLQGFGQRLTFHQYAKKNHSIPGWLWTSLGLIGFAGIMIVGVVKLSGEHAIFFGKPSFFWQAVGLSLIGGLIMLLAHLVRLRDLRHSTPQDIFASDALVNMLIVLFVPGIYFLFGSNGFPFLYLCSATISLLIYTISDPSRVVWISKSKLSEILGIVITFFIAAPIFFTLKGGLFRSNEFIYDSMGSLFKLPIPVSLFFCYLGIIILGNFYRATLGLTVIFLFYMTMMISTVLTSSFAPQLEKAKLLLFMQYLAPTFGLVLGMTYGGKNNGRRYLEKTMFLVFICIAPTQLLATFVQSTPLLTPYIYFISIYQHLQYVPILMAGIFLMGLYSLWDLVNWRRLIIILSPFFGAYIAASGSMMAILLSLVGCGAFPFFHSKRRFDRAQFIVKLSVFILAICSGALQRFWSPGTAFAQKFEGGRLVNLAERVDIWKFYFSEIISDKFVFFFGHSAPPDRNIFPSAHNYYLDLTYNFGLIPTVIILGLIAITLVKLYEQLAEVLSSPPIFSLAMIVIFLFLDNVLKVGFRQPYPGILSFFLWGVLLIRLVKLKISKESVLIMG